MLAGGRRPFDDEAFRAFVRRDIERARDSRALQNHDLIAGDDQMTTSASFSSITVPTLVIHGTADPMFPVEHGEALAAEIPGATLLTIDSAGHGVDRADWDVIVSVVLDQTAAGSRRSD